MFSHLPILEQEKSAMLEARVEQWRQELIAKGRQEGLQAGLRAGLREGMQAGRKEGAAATLTRLLEEKFGPLTPDRREEIWVADSCREAIALF